MSGDQAVHLPHVVTIIVQVVMVSCVVGFAIAISGWNPLDVGKKRGKDDRCGR